MFPIGASQQGKNNSRQFKYPSMSRFIFVYIRWLGEIVSPGFGQVHDCPLVVLLYIIHHLHKTKICSLSCAGGEL